MFAEKDREIESIRTALLEIQEQLNREFVARTEVIKVLMVAAMTHEHVLLVGPPGTAKSTILRSFSRLCDAQYFEYLLTRFTEPNELFGPIDIARFREGVYERKIEGMLPTAEIVFLDEIFKANSAILNSLLMLLNERVYSVGGKILECPLICLFGATNETPKDDSLAAVLDRFLLRVQTPNLEPIHFKALVQVGWQAEQARIQKIQTTTKKGSLSLSQLNRLHGFLAQYQNFSQQFLATYKDIVFKLRNEGIVLSDRNVVKLLKVFAAHAFLDGRDTLDLSDLQMLRYVWTYQEQSERIQFILESELESYYQEHPKAPRPGVAEVDFAQLVAELDRITARLTSNESLMDVELFAHLRSLHELKSAFQSLGTEAAKLKIASMDRLLEFLYQQGPNKS